MNFLVILLSRFYSHVNYSVTKIYLSQSYGDSKFYSHVNYSVTKIIRQSEKTPESFTVT